MLVIAITGGLGSGKTTVREILEDMGALGLDADELARRVVEPESEGARRVRKVFGGQFFDGEGRLDRQKMAQRVFSDQEARDLLESILHPLIKEEEARYLEEISKSKPDAVVVLEIPLLAEGGVKENYDRVVAVTADLETRIRRLFESGRYSRVEAEARIQSQATDEERASVADYIVDNSGERARTREQVAQIWRELQAARRD
jgi:dephospho-CoA kinase